MDGACGTCGGEAHAEFWWGYRRKSILTLTRRREDNIKMDFKEVGLDGVYWILNSVGLLGWLVSPEVSAYSCIVQNKRVCIVQNKRVCIVQHRCVRVIQYKCACMVQCMSILYSKSVSVLYTTSMSVLYTTSVLVL